MVRLTIYSNFQRTTGVGLTTGTLYNVDDEFHVTDVFAPAIFPIDIDNDEHYNVISTNLAQAPNFFLHLRFRVVVTTTGTDVKLDDFDTDCRG